MFIAYLCTLMKSKMLKEENNKALKEGKELPLMEEFYTIQGEGFYSGHAAYFIRLGGCDVGCHWCDVKESWDAELHPLTTVEDMVAKASENEGKLVIITGGEPLMYNLDYLTSELKKEGMQTNIETSGAYEMSGDFDWICLSPKKNKLPTQSVYDAAHELKVVIYNKHDFIFAEEQAARVNDNALLLLQTEWSKRDEMTPLIVEYVKKNPKWKISMQTHKYLDIP